MAKWDRTNPLDWAALFGLVALSYFGPRRSHVTGGCHFMMQDGDAASFALHVAQPSALLHSDLPLAWAWSSHVRHIVILDSATGQAVIRHWDDPDRKKERTIVAHRDAREL